MVGSSEPAAGPFVLPTPKSTIFARPSSVSMMLRGFRSRWTTPASCATARPSATWLAISITRAGVSRSPVDRAVQRLTGDELHDDERPAVQIADVVDGHDIRMVEQGSQPGFAREPLGRDVVRRQLVGHELDGDEPAQPRIPRLVDLSHAAGSEGADDLVDADALARI